MPRLTKRQMIEEMIEGLKFWNNERVIENRTQSPKWKVEEVYNYFNKSKKTREDRAFCINLLTCY